MDSELATDGTVLSFEQQGGGPALVCLHGLTATRRYVLMGSRALERSGHRVILPDARGHGRSEPASAYGYTDLASDVVALLDHLRIERAVLVGASMGAHTGLRVALKHPARVCGLVLITPAYLPRRDPTDLAHWDALAEGLRTGGVDGFIAAYDLGGLDERWREPMLRVLRQRMAAHLHPLAVADALEQVPRSRPFETLADLERIACPTLIVGSRDQADPGHPLATAEIYAQRIPAARLVVEEPGRSPLAWQGGRLSQLIAELS